MKKHLFTIAVLMIALLGITNIAKAQTPAPVDGNKLLPSNIDMAFEFNTSEKNPLEDVLISAMTDAIEAKNDIGISKDDLTALLNNNTIGFGMIMNSSSTDDLSNSEPDMYAYLHLSKDSLDKILAEAIKTVSITTENYKNFTIYTIDHSFISLIQNDLLILTNSKANLETALDNMGTSNNLAGNTNFLEVMSRKLANSFFTMYVNLQSGLNEITDNSDLSDLSLIPLNSVNQDLLKAVLAEGISINQNDTGFNMGVVVQGDKDKLLQLNLPMNKNNMAPSLYQKLSGTGLILYSEKYMSKNWSNDLMKVFNSSTMPEEFTAWKSDFKKATNIDIDTEVLPYLYGQEMFTMHKTNNILPAFTYMLKLDDNRSGIGNLLVKLDTYINQEIQKIENESKMDFFTRSLTTISNTSFYTYTLDIAKLMPETGAENIPSEKMLLTLRMAITSQGDLVISTLSDLDGMLYKGSLTSNTALNRAFTNPNETALAVAFFNIDELHNYITALMDEFKAPSETRSMIDEFMAPWHNIFLKSSADVDTVWGTATVTVDVAGLAKYAALFEKLTGPGSPFQIPENLFSEQQKYCDVGKDDWYESYVTDLDNYNIVKGYDDGCFHPSTNITRAEFTKMALIAAESSGLYFPDDSVELTDGFKDVDYEDDWFAPFIDQAASNKLIRGYDDNTFRPNAPIKRAEAVNILYNMSTKLKAVNTIAQPIESLIPFKDVDKDDWFLTPVAATFHYDLVNGVTPDKFEPNRPLNRAEAAKIISKFMEFER